MTGVQTCALPISLFAREIGRDLLGMATGEAIAHLNCLIARGLATRERQADGTLLYGARR